MISSILVNFTMGLLIDKYQHHKKIFLILDLIFNLLVLYLFKYLTFTLNIINSIIPVNIYKIALPIGISFFTFQAISYVVDVYRGDAAAQKNPIKIGLYISLFPQLIAGPIVRYNTISQQINSRKHSIDAFVSGLHRFVLGLAKKILIANNMAIVADYAFGSAQTADIAWLGALAYTLQIFFDFSGYSDMAIGLAEIFGFKLEENFNYPYIASSISDFWRRWHISLGTWFRDYVYFPLGGSRGTKFQLVRNLFIVWTLTGMWHGASYNFIIWGFFYFVLIAAEKLFDLPGRLNNKLLKLIYRFFTLFSVIMGWVVFRAPSMTQAINYMGVMFSSTIDNTGKLAFYVNEYKYYFMAAIIFAVPSAPYLYKELEKNDILFSIGSVLKAGIYILLFVYCTSYLVMGGNNPFIYFNF